MVKSRFCWWVKPPRHLFPLKKCRCFWVQDQKYKKSLLKHIQKIPKALNKNNRFQKDHVFLLLRIPRFCRSQQRAHWTPRVAWGGGDPAPHGKRAGDAEAWPGSGVFFPKELIKKWGKTYDIGEHLGNGDFGIYELLYIIWTSVYIYILYTICTSWCFVQSQKATIIGRYLETWEPWGLNHGNQGSGTFGWSGRIQGSTVKKHGHWKVQCQKILNMIWKSMEITEIRGTCVFRCFMHFFHLAMDNPHPRMSIQIMDCPVITVRCSWTLSFQLKSLRNHNPCQAHARPMPGPSGPAVLSRGGGVLKYRGSTPIDKPSSSGHFSEPSSDFWGSPHGETSKVDPGLKPKWPRTTSSLSAIEHAMAKSDEFLDEAELIPALRISSSSGYVFLRRTWCQDVSGFKNFWMISVDLKEYAWDRMNGWAAGGSK